MWKFDDPDGAQRAIETLTALSKQELIRIYDAATVEWQPGKKRPKTRQAIDLVGAGALDGAFWGLLFGVLFFVPVLGMVVGAAAGAMGGALTDVGIDDDFIDSVKAKVQPGTSALFVLSSDAVTDKVKAAFDGVSADLIYTNMSNEEEAKLRAVFADD